MDFILRKLRYFVPWSVWIACVARVQDRSKRRSRGGASAAKEREAARPDRRRAAWLLITLETEEGTGAAQAFGKAHAGRRRPRQGHGRASEARPHRQRQIDRRPSESNGRDMPTSWWARTSPTASKTVAEVMTVWMESPGHRENILADFTEMGAHAPRTIEGD